MKRLFTRVAPGQEQCEKPCSKSTPFPCAPQEMRALIPSDQQHLSARRERRDQLLMGLARLKKEHQESQG